MSLYAKVIFECDSKDCRGELVMDTTDADYTTDLTSGVQAEFYAGGWRRDDEGLLHCPRCCEPDERDDWT
jgi:hypothetical protein